VHYRGSNGPVVAPLNRCMRGPGPSDCPRDPCRLDRSTGNSKKQKQKQTDTHTHTHTHTEASGKQAASSSQPASCLPSVPFPFLLLACPLAWLVGWLPSFFCWLDRRICLSVLLLSVLSYRLEVSLSFKTHHKSESAPPFFNPFPTSSTPTPLFIPFTFPVPLSRQSMCLPLVYPKKSVCCFALLAGCCLASLSLFLPL